MKLLLTDQIAKAMHISNPAMHTSNRPPPHSLVRIYPKAHVAADASHSIAI